MKTVRERLSIPCIPTLLVVLMVIRFANADNGVDKTTVITPEGLEARTEQKASHKPPQDLPFKPLPPPLPPESFQDPSQASHPQVQRARRLLRQWQAVSVLRPPQLGSSSSSHELEQRASKQAEREYRSYYRLAEGLRISIQWDKRSHSQSRGQDAIVPLPNRPCDRVRWLADKVGVPAIPQPRTPTPITINGNLSTKDTSALDRQLGVDQSGLVPGSSNSAPPFSPVSQSGCAESAKAIGHVADALQQAFGPLPEWTVFRDRWVKRALLESSSSPTRSRGAPMQTDPRAAGKTLELPAGSDGIPAKATRDPSPTSLPTSGSPSSPLTPAKVPTRVKYLGH